LESGVGRYYYGLCDPCGNAVGEGIIFRARTLDLPECSYGSSWERVVQWEDVIDPGLGAITVAVNFTNRAVVDAYGTLMLPGLGAVPALRVNETNTYATFWPEIGLPLGIQHFHNLYWLAPGIGKAVIIISQASATGPPALTASPGRVLRVFEASGDDPLPITNFAAQLQGNQVFLSWDSMGPGARYVIAQANSSEFAGSPAETAPALAQGMIPSALSRLRMGPSKWVPFLTNDQNFVFINPGLSPTNRFFRVRRHR
jgi:hypothetical protein